MPVQINEIIVRSVVDSSTGPERGVPENAGSRDSRVSESEMLEKVLEIIKESKER